MEREILKTGACLVIHIVVEVKQCQFFTVKNQSIKHRGDTGLITGRILVICDAFDFVWISDWK